MSCHILCLQICYWQPHHFNVQITTTMRGLVPLLLSILFLHLYGEGASAEFDETLFEGDIILSDDQKRMIYGNDGNVTMHNARIDARWPNGRIPYYIDPERFSHRRKRQIERAMEIYRTETCIEFVPVAKNSREHHVNIKNPSIKNKCSSAVGRREFFGNTQSLNIGDDCSFGT